MSIERQSPPLPPRSAWGRGVIGALWISPRPITFFGMGLGFGVWGHIHMCPHLYLYVNRSICISIYLSIYLYRFVLPFPSQNWTGQATTGSIHLYITHFPLAIEPAPAGQRAIPSSEQQYCHKHLPSASHAGICHASVHETRKRTQQFRSGCTMFERPRNHGSIHLYAIEPAPVSQRALPSSEQQCCHKHLPSASHAGICHASVHETRKAGT